MWSDPRTCASQTMVLASKQVPMRCGGTYHDVDEADDVIGLVRRAPQGLAEVGLIRGSFLLFAADCGSCGGIVCSFFAFFRGGTRNSQFIKHTTPPDIW